MTQRLYFVVEFINYDNSAAFVPETWVVGKKRCFWPPAKLSSKVNNLLKNFTDPKETWPSYAIKIVAEAEATSFEEAEKKRDRSLHQTDPEISESCDGLPVKRKKVPSHKRRMQTIASSSDDDDDDDEDNRPPTLPPPVYRSLNPAKKSVAKALCLDTQRKRFQFPVNSQIEAGFSVKKPTSIDGQSNQSLHSLDDDEIDAGEDVPDCLDGEPDKSLDDSEIDIGEDIATSIKSTPNHSRGISAQLQASLDVALRAMDARLQATLKATLKTMGHKVLNVQQDIKQMSKSVYKTERNMDLILPHFKVSLPTELPAAFPIKDGEELKQMDQLVNSDSGIFEQIVKALVGVGGNTTDEFIRRTMIRLMKNEFAKCCSVFGRKDDKIRLKDTVIFNSVFAAVKMNLATKECTEKDVESSMRKWLQNSRDRAGGSRYGQKKSQECHNATI